MINPKRKKSKDNPYTIIFNNLRNIYIVSFKDGTNKLNEVEVSKEVFDVFNDSELNDISTMHKDRKHIDFRSYDDSEVIENYLFNNSRNNYKYLEVRFIETKKITLRIKKTIYDRMLLLIDENNSKVKDMYEEVIELGILEKMKGGLIDNELFKKGN